MAAFFSKSRAISSVGSEHLVYTQGVRGSNPLSPTKGFQCIVEDLFYVPYLGINIDNIC